MKPDIDHLPSWIGRSEGVGDMTTATDRDDGALAMDATTTLARAANHPGDSSP